jgi:hypothetical protein
MTPLRRPVRIVVLLSAAALAGGVLLVTSRHSARASEPAALLPKLVADKADNFEVQQYNVAGAGNRLLLRFNGYIENEGGGAVDFRGSREAPEVKSSTAAKVKYDEEHHTETLEPAEQAEEAQPPMNTFQRLFLTNLEETNMERLHSDEPSGGELVYSSADGHDHWHLQRIARYSLVKGTTEVAPAQKVGFCLDDSEHVNKSIGPSGAVYSEANGREFCDRYHPNATKLWEGISRGWRDKYEKNLYFQWVDISNVLPGEYQLREEVNPLGFVKEEGGAKPASYAAATVPGYDALPQSLTAPGGQETAIGLTSSSFSPRSGATYKIVSGPSHGTLGSISGSHVSYTPAPGYAGADSFTFSAQESGSAFPEHPQVATVSIEVTKAPGETPPPGEGETPPPGEGESPPPGEGEALLLGDASTSYGVGDQTAGGREESFQFTAKASGTIEELQLRTNGTANSGITGLVLAVFAESAGKPGAVLGQGSFSGQPATSSWIKVSGLSVGVTAGTKYWLVALPLGPSSTVLHYNTAIASGGTANLESVAAGLKSATPESAWETFNQGPVGFQARGAMGGVVPPPSPGIAITAAPSALVAGTGATVTAHPEHDAGGIDWEVSGVAGSVKSEGPAGEQATVLAGAVPGTLTLTARLADDPAVADSRQITVTPVPADEPAPGLPPVTGTKGGVAGQQTETPAGGLSQPRAMLIGRRLFMTTYARRAGRVRLSAYIGRHDIGFCDSPTTAARTFTCELKLKPRQLDARVKIVASLRVAGGQLLAIALPARRVPRMTMAPAGKIHIAGRAASYASVYWCSPSALVDTLEANSG